MLLTFILPSNDITQQVLARIDDSLPYWVGQQRDKEQDHVSQLSELASKTESAIVHNVEESESRRSPSRFANSCSGYARRCHRRAAGQLGRRAQQKGNGVGIFGALTGILFGDVTLTQESELAAAGQAAKQGGRRERDVLDGVWDVAVART